MITYPVRFCAAVAIATTMPAAAQEAATGQAAGSPAVTAAAGAVPAGIIVRRDTPVHLMVMSEVSTKERGIGYRFKLRVNQPIIVGGAVVIPVGTLAWGEVTSASSSGNVGKSGTLSAKLLHIDLNGTLVPLTGETQAAGKSGSGEAVMAVLALGVFGLFAKGNNAKIKAGELMTGFVAADTPVSLPPVAASPPPPIPPVAPAAPSAPAAPARS